MKNASVLRLLIAAVIWLALFIIASSCGLIHPVCYAYAGTAIPLLFGFVYLYASSNLQGFGAAAILNGFTLVTGLVMGEGNPAFIIGIIILTVLAELIRKVNGWHTLKGVCLSFIPLAFSFYAYAAHWWTDTEGSLAEAALEMPAGYADKMAPVIANIPMLAIMLILTVPVAILAMKLSVRVMRKQAAALS